MICLEIPVHEHSSFTSTCILNLFEIERYYYIVSKDAKVLLFDLNKYVKKRCIWYALLKLVKKNLW